MVEKIDENRIYSISEVAEIGRNGLSSFFDSKSKVRKLIANKKLEVTEPLNERGERGIFGSSLLKLITKKDL